MHIYEISSPKAHYISSCTNTFDERGTNKISQLPWTDVTQCAQDMEEPHANIPKQEFFDRASAPAAILNKVKNHKCEYGYTKTHVFFIYDTADDIHYFFTV